jgi:leucyl aminopeptidase
MLVRVTENDLGILKSDLGVCFAYENDKHPRGIKDARLRRELAAEMKAEGFKGLPGDRVIWNADGRYASHRFLVIGLGREKPAPGEAIRGGCARAAREAAKISARRIGLKLPPVAKGRVAAEARAAVEGAALGAYQFDRYLTDPTRKKVKLREIELSADGATAAVKRAVTLGRQGALAVCLARDLVNEGPSRMTPRALSAVAARESKGNDLRCKILGLPELRRLGMSSLLSVARGSSEPPRVVHLTYKPARNKTKQRIVLVGKGVTFDSGGLNLKPGQSMLTMKSDMAGAAAVLATMTALKKVGCAVEVHALLGLVENMTGAAAYKPGDILDTYAGKSVEVGNTDAEGRLVMCDLLAYAADKLKPTQMVDVATLTGACVVALGTLASGLFTRHEPVRDRLLEAGSAAGEKIWQLPMYDEYLQLLQKGPADLCNVGGRWGGAITAALFLGEFVPRQLPWAHLDIAGPAFTETDLPEAPLGATGAGVLTLLRWLESI